MKDNFAASLARVLVYEGGKVDDPRDPGGRTNQGVTQASYDAYRHQKFLPRQDVYRMANAERDDIYKTAYWDRIHGDELPAGVDFCIFDAAVNSGVGGAANWAQAVCGLLPTDGDFGPQTLRGVLSARPMTFIDEFCQRRLGTLQRLRTWSVYGRGWSARITNVRKIADAMDNAVVNPQDGPINNPVDVTGLNGHQKADVDNVKPPLVSRVTTHIVTGGGAITTVAAQAGQQLQPLQDTFSWLKYVLGGLTILGVIAGILVTVSQKANEAAQTGGAKVPVNSTADAGLPEVEVPK